MQIAAAKFSEGMDEAHVVARLSAGAGFTEQGEFLQVAASEHLAEPYITRDGAAWACRRTGELVMLVPIHSGSAS